MVSSCFLKFWTLKLSINGIQAYVLTGQADVVLMLNLYDTEKCCQVFHDDGDPHWEKETAVRL